MNNLFLKYLPVEGEIKEHDIVQTNKGIGTVVYIWSPTDFEVEYDDIGTMASSIPNIKPVKLFLCSRDIEGKVDEEVYFDDPLNESSGYKKLIEGLQGGMYKIDSKPWAIYPEEAIKVIGEISPKALKYVKEGDIDENLVKISEYPICPKCGAIDNAGFCPHEIECEIDKKRTVVFVKCECCENFN